MSTPTTFEAHGHKWNAHNTGDGYPCDGDKKVLVCFKDGTDSGTSSMAVEWWEWDNPAEGEEIIGWRLAAPPQEKDELTRLREENASMRTAINEARIDFERIRTKTHCAAMAGPAAISTLGDAWNEFDLLSVQAAAASQKLQPFIMESK